LSFYGSPLNRTSLTCGFTAVEATQSKEQGKDGNLSKKFLHRHIFSFSGFISTVFLTLIFTNIAAASTLTDNVTK